MRYGLFRWTSVMVSWKAFSKVTAPGSVTVVVTKGRFVNCGVADVVAVVVGVGVVVAVEVVVVVRFNAGLDGGGGVVVEVENERWCCLVLRRLVVDFGFLLVVVCWVW